MYCTPADAMFAKAYGIIDELSNEVAHIEGDNRALKTRESELEAQAAADAKVVEAILAERVAENDWRKSVESRERWMTYRFECTDSEWLEFQEKEQSAARALHKAKLATDAALAARKAAPEAEM